MPAPNRIAPSPFLPFCRAWAVSMRALGGKPPIRKGTVDALAH